MRSGWHEMSKPHIIFDEQVGSCLVQQLDRLDRTNEPSINMVQRSSATLRTIDSHSLRDKRSDHLVSSNRRGTSRQKCRDETDFTSTTGKVQRSPSLLNKIKVPLIAPRQT
jgi:hypothetical protein